MPITDVNTRRRRLSSAKTLVSTKRKKADHATMMDKTHPSPSWVLTNAFFYVMSGVTQPILMAYASHAGLANPKAQLYMLFYYIGPALAAFSLRCRCSNKKVKAKDETTQLLSNGVQTKRYSYNNNTHDNDSINITASSLIQNNGDAEEEEEHWPSTVLLTKASGIAIFDIFAQSMVYTGNNLAGPTVFAIIYSSVTIWAAIFSRILLSRSLVIFQWAGVCLVVVGLALTAIDSKTVGKNVFAGAILILVGSSFHGLTYVMSERIMTPSHIISSVNGTHKEPEHLSIKANCAVQGIVAMVLFLLWQIFYTLPRIEPLILEPMREAGTSALHALIILVTITLANYVHSITFYVTLRHFPGGATSAGVLKGLQAVLVFAVSAMILCERWGGNEMCWSNSKGISLVVVVSGIMIYGTFTEKKGNVKERRKEEEINERAEIL